MLIDLTQDDIQYRFTTFEEKERFINIFFKQIDRIISIENHRFKFEGPLQIECMLNKIARDNGINIIFTYRKVDQDYLVAFDTEEIHLLQDILDIFRYEYRRNAGC